MKVIVTKSYEELSEKAFEVIKPFIKDGGVLGLATGSTPIGLYNKMVEYHKNENVSFKGIKTFNLDEYVNLPLEHPESYYSFMHRYLFDHVDIDENNIHIPSGLGNDINDKCVKYEEMIDNYPVDIQLLGIGRDGHIGFNEPNTSFDSITHVTDLAQETITDNARFFDNDISKVPTQAATQGLGTIMKARNILLVANGKNKAQAIKNMIEGPIDEKCPASILQKHPNVIVVIDEDAASLLSK